MTPFLVTMSLVVAAAEPAHPCSSAQQCDEACTQGSLRACVQLGQLVLATDPARAIRGFQRACDGGEGLGCHGIANAYRSGTGVPVDPVRALGFDRAACDRKHGPSCLSLARSYERSAEGLGNPKRADEEMGRAASLFFKGCEGGAFEACGESARLYLWGVGTPVNAQGARSLAERGCLGGDAGACKLLSVLLNQGFGGAMDPARAREFDARARKARARSVPLATPPVPTAGVALSLSTPAPGVDVFVDGMLAGASPTTIQVPPGVHLVEAADPTVLPSKITCAPQGACAAVLTGPTTLTVTSNVAAQLELDGARVGKAPWSGPVAPGTHRIKASFPGSRTLERSVEVPAGGSLIERMELSDEPTTLSVECDPGGAAVIVDGKEVGTAPWSGEVTPGKHTVRLTLDGHAPTSRTVTLARGQPLTERFVLVALTGRLSLTSQPAGAAVTLDGVVVGKTPWSGTLPRGLRTFELSLDGYTVIRDSLVLEAKTSRSFQLSVLETKLEIRTSPEGAAVVVDGVAAGASPWTGVVKPGRKAVTLSLEGYEPLTIEVDAAKAQTTTKNVELKPSTVSVFIDSVPSGALVLIDGAPRGKSPLSLRLAPGKHSVELSLDGSERLTATAEAGPGLNEWRYTLFPTKPATPEPAPPPAVAAPAAPPPPPPIVLAEASAESLQKVLSDPAVDIARKHSLLKQHTGDLTELIDGVKPDSARGALCVAFRARVYPATIEVSYSDSFGDEVEGSLELNGLSFGRLPFKGQVPSCVTEVTARGESTQESRAVEKLDRVSRNSFRFEVKGRTTIGAISLVGDLAVAYPGWGDGVQVIPSGGLRLERWGRVVHLSATLRATSLFAQELGLPVFPALDAFFGLGGGFVTTNTQWRFAFDVGVWNMVNPTARISVAWQVLGGLLLTGTFDLHYHYLGVLPDFSRGRYSRIDPVNFLYPGFTLAAGYAW